MTIRNKSRISVQDKVVTLKLKAIEARWLLSSFAFAQDKYCIKGSQRWCEAQELCKTLAKEINDQTQCDFANGEDGF